mgnify:CR=1 FL=1
MAAYIKDCRTTQQSFVSFIHPFSIPSNTAFSTVNSCASEGIVDAADDQIAKAQVFRGQCHIFHRDPGVKRTPFVGTVSA